MVKPLAKCRNAAELDQQQHEKRLAKITEHEDAQFR
jgi:hypothetical protein